MVVGDGRLAFGIQWPGRYHRESDLVLRRGEQLHVHGDFSIYSGATVAIGEGTRLTLGGACINGDASIAYFLDVRFGNDVAVGPELVLIDDDRHQLSRTRDSSGPMVIGDHVWLCSRVTVLKCVTIGNGAILAPGTVVTKDVPACELWGDMLARFIRAATWS